VEDNSGAFLAIGTKGHDDRRDRPDEWLVRLAHRAHLSSPPGSPQQNGSRFTAWDEEVGRRIAEQLSDLPEPELVAALIDYARMLHHHRAFVAIRAGIERYDGDAWTNDPKTAELERRLQLWPLDADVTWDRFRTWAHERGIEVSGSATLSGHS
jgi:hypothetical protein